MKPSLTVVLVPRIATRLVPALRRSSTPWRGQGHRATERFERLESRCAGPVSVGVCYWVVSARFDLYLVLVWRSVISMYT